MRLRTLLVLLAVSTLVVTAPAAFAGDPAPIQLALVNPVQLVNEDYSVRGLRISLIYGVNRDLTGLDFSLVGQNRGDVRGVHLCLAGLTEGNFTGVQWGLLNMTDTLNGLQIGILNVVKRKDTLPVLPLVNWSFD